MGWLETAMLWFERGCHSSTTIVVGHTLLKLVITWLSSKMDPSLFRFQYSNERPKSDINLWRSYQLVLFTHVNELRSFVDCDFVYGLPLGANTALHSEDVIAPCNRLVMAIVMSHSYVAGPWVIISWYSNWDLFIAMIAVLASCSTVGCIRTINLVICCWCCCCCCCLAGGFAF